MPNEFLLLSGTVSAAPGPPRQNKAGSRNLPAAGLDFYDKNKTCYRTGSTDGPRVQR
jgi:hypothetical protein